MRADIYSYGMVVAFCLTGDSPWGDVKTTILSSCESWDPSVAKVSLPENLPFQDNIREIIELCYTDDPENRPESAQDVVDRFFKG